MSSIGIFVGSVDIMHAVDVMMAPLESLHVYRELYTLTNRLPTGDEQQETEMIFSSQTSSVVGSNESDQSPTRPRPVGGSMWRWAGPRL